MRRPGLGYIVGAYEHPLRDAPDRSVAQLHAEVAAGALADAGLTKDDVDGLFCGPDTPGTGPLSMADYMNLNLRHVDTTNTSGSSYLIHVAHACQAIAAGKCDVALITLAGRPRQEGKAKGSLKRADNPNQPDFEFEHPFGIQILGVYAMVAQRHAHLYGTTAEQMAWVKVAFSHHAQHNPNAKLRNVVTVEDVVNSPLVADPLHRLDCCVVTDGGGALVVTREEIAKSLDRPLVKVIGCGEAPYGQAGGYAEITDSGARRSGATAYAQANVTPADIRYASIYDSFTITAMVQLEDLGFCEKGEIGAFVSDGGLISGSGRLAVNTDGGGLCNNHPVNRGGMTKALEAVRQIRGEAHPAVQVPDCDLALANAIGGQLGVRHASSTIILERG
ncbi:thiolase domain-containing protein [Acuticoccus mangrovi]|uniref:Thiolase domain-containing protein n=1 Tax=Acuticoccus mangrovi TaxID=2796142 RepID=A0A934MHL8_9HYPH|nr:thiolase domain-containing protein [Acuticoccus mangrovi]MBJ3777070.1 thiolase domain-containing protein [Acuticoccus mangrovi]